MRLYCGKINEEFLGNTLTVMGWVSTIRNLGGLLFCDIRDRTGILQISFPRDSESLKIGQQLKPEFVVKITGKAAMRPQANPDIFSGKVELIVESAEILNTSDVLPIIVNDRSVNEEARLKYRVLDLRGDFMQHNLRVRHQVSQIIRNYLSQEGFMEIETPFLTRSTPEGARDFLVPARMHPGAFYALPQSPQLFKQLLMVAGYDKYFQIVRCFRDEDLRGDRQPEFTQVDIETSFLSADEIRFYAATLVKKVFSQILNVDLGEIPTMLYKEAMDYYGCDKPDLRFDMKFIELKQALQGVELEMISNAAVDTESRIIGLKLENHDLSRKELDEISTSIGKPLFYIKAKNVKDLQDGFTSSIAKFLTTDILNKIIATSNLNDGDMLLFVAGKTAQITPIMCNLRLQLAEKFNLYKKDWAVTWIVDFPMFEYDADEKKYNACHHPFTAPKGDTINMENPLENLANAYDLVINGMEAGGGSVRIHNMDVQQQVFDILGLSKDQAKDKFGFLLDNLRYGAPPHGGLAFGLDRLVALLCGCKHIRDVIAFPKTNTGQCLLTNAPNIV